MLPNGVFGYTGRYTNILQNLSAVHGMLYLAFISVSTSMKEIPECIKYDCQSTTGHVLVRTESKISISTK